MPHDAARYLVCEGVIDSAIYRLNGDVVVPCLREMRIALESLLHYQKRLADRVRWRAPLLLSQPVVKVANALFLDALELRVFLELELHVQYVCGVSAELPSEDHVTLPLQEV